MRMEELKKRAGSVDGWLTDPEGECLYRLARHCTGEGVIVEIGSWKGRSTLWLGWGSKAGKRARVYAIDPHTGSSEHQERDRHVHTLEEFKGNIAQAGLDEIVIPVVETSAAAARRFALPVELIFIDGAHEYDLVRLDFESWFPKVLEGGIMAFHDTIGSPGPKRVAETLVYASRAFRNVRLVDSITLAEKVTQNSLRDRARSRCVLLLKNAFAGKTHLPKPIRWTGKTLLRWAA
jgi:MMP 1-O-methyltransferase